MIVKDRAVMVFSLGKSAKRENQMPSTRMGIAALLRKHLTEAQEFLDENKVKKNKKQKKKYIEDALLPVIEGRVPVMIHCERKDDILTALRLAEEYHLHIIIEGGTAAWQVADHLKRRNIPVIINQQFRGNGNIEDHQFNSKNAVMLDQAGVKIAFSHEEGSWLVPGTSQPGGDLLEIAAFAYRQGLPEQAALRAITLSPAEMYGISDRVGSLEVGKDADIIILGGHPLRTAGTVKAVFIQGKLVYCQQQDQFTQTDDLE
jgi:imidazolonepropionase-like amidohydrolase